MSEGEQVRQAVQPVGLVVQGVVPVHRVRAGAIHVVQRQSMHAYVPGNGGIGEMPVVGDGNPHHLVAPPARFEIVVFFLGGIESRVAVLAVRWHQAGGDIPQVGAGADGVRPPATVCEWRVVQRANTKQVAVVAHAETDVGSVRIGQEALPAIVAIHRPAIVTIDRHQIPKRVRSRRRRHRVTCDLQSKIGPHGEGRNPQIAVVVELAV